MKFMVKGDNLMSCCGNCAGFSCDKEGHGQCNKLSMTCKAGQKSCMYFENKKKA